MAGLSSRLFFFPDCFSFFGHIRSSAHASPGGPAPLFLWPGEAIQDQVKSKGLLWNRRFNEIDSAPDRLKQTTKGSTRQRMSIMGKMGEWQVCGAFFKTKTAVKIHENCQSVDLL